MLDGPDVSVALRGGVRSRTHAWDFVRWFADAWMGRPLEPADGCGEGELAAVEAELGFELPAALREGYSLFGRRQDLTRRQDPLVPATGLYVADGVGGLLVFRQENQDCAFWGIPLAEIEQDDPPVLVESRDGSVPFLDQVSLAWVELVLSESLFGADDLRLYDACELPESLLPSLHESYARVDLPDHPLWAGEGDSPVPWFSAPGRLVRRDGIQDHSWIHARGRTAADLESCAKNFPAPGSAEAALPGTSTDRHLMGLGPVATRPVLGGSTMRVVRHGASVSASGGGDTGPVFATDRRPGTTEGLSLTAQGR
ncbi:SMI1/KNR4 family protein [Streptomyces sp. NPDC059466]|uniref:SMI1/KNR4 family protein n=1 Tax=unclassified Streptomyces TaxID=2593676 RepID=UPI0036A1BEDC